jgi:PAS domain-containing protein
VTARPLTLLLFAAAGAAAAAVLLLLPHLGIPAIRAALVLLAAAAALLITVGMRMTGFLRRLARLARRLMDGDFESGMRVAKRPADEVTVIERRMDCLAQRLRGFDMLRTARVLDLQRALDLLLQHLDRPVMLFDVRREVLECNPGWRETFGIAQQSLPFGAVERIPENAPLIALLRRAMETGQSPEPSHVHFRLPPQESARAVTLRIVPVKEGDGAVDYVFVLARSAPPTTSASA